MKKNIVYLMLASLLLFTGCADYLDQDPEDLNSMDKIFSSKIETTKWYNRIYSDDFMVQEMHYSGQIPYFWCTDESAYILESHVRNIAEGKMSPDNYYGYTGSYNLYFFVRYYQAIRHCNLFLENVDKCAELGEIDRRTMRGSTARSTGPVKTACPPPATRNSRWGSPPSVPPGPSSRACC